MATTKFVAVLAQLKDQNSPGPGFTTAWLDQLCAVVRQYWLDMSGGRQDIAWSVRPNPLVLNIPLTPEVGSEALVLKARAQAASDGTPFAATEHLLVIRDWTAPGAGATATDPTVVGTALTPSLICHEMGHFFQRANHQPSGHASVFNGWISLDYVDEGCVMGGEGDKTKSTFPAVPPPILNLHNAAGPAMSPAMVDLCGWLDKGNPGAVLDATQLLPFGTPIATWRGAPPSGRPGPHSVLTFDGLAPHDDRIYLSLRSPAAPWDAGLDPPPIDPARPNGAAHPAGTPRLVAHELAPSGATYRLAECAAVPGAEMRLGRAPLHVGVVDTIADGVRLRLRRDPWRGWVEPQVAGPALDPASRVAAVARGERIDLFVVDRGGAVQGRHFDSDLWEEWYPVPGSGASPTSGLAVAAGSPDQLTVFVVDAGARLRRRRWVDGVWEEGWPEIAVGGLDATASLAATASGPDRIELFATDDSGRVLHATVVGGAAGTWEVLPELPRARSLAATMITDRDISVHAVSEGAGDQRLWSIVGREGSWGEWVSHGQVDLAETAGIAAVSTRLGTADLVAAGDPLWARRYQAGAWAQNPDLIAGSRCGDDSTVASVSRTPECVDVIVVTREGRVAVTSRSASTDFRPAHRELIRRVRTSLVSPGGRFLTVRPVGWTAMLFADADTQGPAEEFTIKVLADYNDSNGPKHVIAVQAHDGRYVCAEAGGGRELTVTRTRIDPWETFLIPAGVTYVSITALGGHLWSIDEGLDVRCDQVSKGDNEYFVMVPVP